MTNTCGCGRPAHDAHLCHRCTTSLERQLRDVAGITHPDGRPSLDLARQLAVAIARQTAYGERTRARSAETSLPFDPHASEAAWVLRSTLLGAAASIAHELRPGWRNPPANLSGPTPEGDALKGAESTALIARWLLEHVADIRRRSDAHGLAEEVAFAVKLATKAVDAPANRTVVTVGRCPEEGCGGEVRAYIPADPQHAPHMTCSGEARHRWEAHQWTRAGRRILAETNTRKAQ